MVELYLLKWQTQMGTSDTLGRCGLGWQERRVWPDKDGWQRALGYGRWWNEVHDTGHKWMSMDHIGHLVDERRERAVESGAL
jgi:hypothetical protein